MSDVTRILSQIESGDPSAAEQLLPLVYDELRKLAAAKLAREKPGQTLQATALVHDAYIRLVDVEQAQHWNSRGHFFGAAAKAMRRILVEQARRKHSLKQGGLCRRREADLDKLSHPEAAVEVLEVDEALGIKRFVPATWTDGTQSPAAFRENLRAPVAGFAAPDRPYVQVSTRHGDRQGEVPIQAAAADRRGRGWAWCTWPSRPSRSSGGWR
jgi:RNA polymerase sigma factor (TIGR02999 family)